MVLECTAGSGSTVGDQFEQLHYIISRIDDSSRIGVRNMHSLTLLMNCS